MDHERMLAWARRQLADFTTENYDFFERENPFAIIASHASVPPNYVVRLIENPRRAPFPDDWVFKIGDIVHNLRVSLDYLAHHVILKHSPSADVSRIAFPIARETTDYASLEGKALAKAPEEARRLFRKFQPKFGPNAESFEPLALLDALENVHKHRKLLSADVAISELGIRPKPGLQLDLDGVEWYDNGLQYAPLRDGTELGRLRDPDAKIQVYAHFHVCFDPSGPGQGRVVVRSLRLIADHIGDEIFAAFAPFI